MAEQELVLETLARGKLKLCKNTIEKTKPTQEQIRKQAYRLQPSEPKDLEVIRYFDRVSQSVFLGRAAKIGTLKNVSNDTNHLKAFVRVFS